LARRNPELAVLSVLAHSKGKEEDVLPSVRMAAEEVSDLDYRRSVLYLDAILSAVSDAVRMKLEDQMRIGDYEIQNESVRQYYEKLLDARAEGEKDGEHKGLIQGKLQALLRNLKGRGIELSEEQRETVLQCTDSDTVDRWLDRSLTAASADELFH